MEEIRAGDARAAAQRLSIVEGLAVLAFDDEVRHLVREYDRRLGLPPAGRADLPHLAFAVAYEMDYLVTWNCRHIANGEIIRKLIDVNLQLDRFTPLIVTPEELLGMRGESAP
jgi:hypothetical protein